MEMEITLDRQPGGAVLRLHGELDALASPRATRAIDAEVAAGERSLVLDLNHVRFLDSTGIEAIFCAARTLAERGGRLVLSRPSPFCRDVLARVGLDRYVEIVDSEEDALACLRGDHPAAPMRH
jgi:anti-anti-sigma factor